MTPVMLIDELKVFIEEIVKNYWLETKNDTSKAPQVITGYLPPKKSTPDPDYPFVIVRLSKGKDQQGSGGAVVRIIIGTYSEDSQNGWRDVANIIDRIWNELMKKQVIGKKFKIEYPLDWDIPEEQPYPYWIGVMDTNWTVPHPVPLMEGIEL